MNPFMPDKANDKVPVSSSFLTMGRILATVEAHPKSNSITLRKHLPSTTMYRYIPDLVEIGLLAAEPKNVPGVRKKLDHYDLTKDGKTIVEIYKRYLRLRGTGQAVQPAGEIVYY